MTLPLSCPSSEASATTSNSTGKERDAETGLDYFGARYLSSAAGRWVSPDWSATVAPIPYAKLGYPQSLNLYAYAENNPLTMVDADGHCGTGSPIPCSPEDDRIADSGAAQEAFQAQAAVGRIAEGKLKAQQQNSRQRWEAQDEKNTKASIASYPTAPAGARMTLTGCTNKVCDYTLSGAGGAKYVYEHFANDQVAGSKSAGHGDFTTSLTGLAGGYPEEQITALGGTLDTHRFFTISSSATYHPNKQMSVMIFEAGHNVSYEHLYDAAANAPSYVNGLPAASYHP